MASLMYGAGLRLMECLRLGVKDLDFATGQIVIRAGKAGCAVKTSLDIRRAEIGSLQQHRRQSRR